MYIDPKKLVSRLVKALAIIAILFGLLTYMFAVNVQQQTAAALTAIFGLQFLWYLQWRALHKPPATRPVAPTNTSGQTDQAASGGSTAAPRHKTSQSSGHGLTFRRPY